MLHLMRRDVEQTRRAAKRLEKLLTEHSFVFMSLTATCWVRWTDAYDNSNRDTIRALHDAAKAWWSGGVGNYKSVFRPFLPSLK